MQMIAYEWTGTAMSEYRNANYLVQLHDGAVEAWGRPIGVDDGTSVGIASEAAFLGGQLVRNGSARAPHVLDR
jgi:hypothetical protein